MPEDSGSRRYCGNCGAEVRASNRFCVSCGASNGPSMLNIDKEQFSNYVRIASSFISRSASWVKEIGKRQPGLTAIVSIIGLVVLLSVAKTVAYLPLIGGFLSFLGYLAMVPFFLALIPPAIEWRKKQVQQNEERKRQEAQRAEEERRKVSKPKYNKSTQVEFDELVRKCISKYPNLTSEEQAKKLSEENREFMERYYAEVWGCKTREEIQREREERRREQNVERRREREIERENELREIGAGSVHMGLFLQFIAWLLIGGSLLAIVGFLIVLVLAFVSELLSGI